MNVLKVEVDMKNGGKDNLQSRAEQSRAEQSRAEQSREITLDILRGVAILIVVFGHAIQVSLLEGESSFLWSKIILNLQMPLLFCISGYTAGFSYPSSNTKKFIAKKIKRLLVPYIVWETLHYLLVCMVPGNYRVLSGGQFIKEFFVSDFWFLRVLFVYYIVLWLYNIFFNLFHIQEKVMQSIFLLSGCVVIWMLMRVKLINSLSVWYYIWFLIGLLFFKYKNILNVYKVKGTYKWIVLFVLGVIIAFGIRVNISSKILTMFLVVEISLIICVAANIIPEKIKDYLIHVGKNTLPVYGIHWCLLFSPIFRINGYQLVRSILPLYISAFFIAILWMIVCEVMVWILMKNKMGRILFLGVR